MLIVLLEIWKFTVVEEHGLTTMTRVHTIRRAACAKDRGPHGGTGQREDLHGSKANRLGF